MAKKLTERQFKAQEKQARLVHFTLGGSTAGYSTPEIFLVILTYLNKAGKNGLSLNKLKAQAKRYNKMRDMAPKLALSKLRLMGAVIYSLSTKRWYITSSGKKLRNNIIKLNRSKGRR